MPPSPLRSRLLLFAAALLFSTGGAAIKAVTLTGWQVAGIRSGIAALVLLALLPEARRGWSPRLVPVSAAYAATLILFVLANRLTTAADAIFLQSTAPLYLLLLGPLLLREPIRGGDVLYMLAVIVGMVVFFIGTEAAAATAPDPRRGNLVALASGFTYALLLVGMRSLSRHGQGDTAVAAAALGNVLACVAALPLAIPVTHTGWTNAVIMVYLGVVQVGLGYLCLTRGIRHVPAMEATTLLMVEPAMSPVWTWLIHGEKPAPWALAGGSVILAATLVNTWRHSRNSRRIKV